MKLMDAPETMSAKGTVGKSDPLMEALKARAAAYAELNSAPPSTGPEDDSFDNHPAWRRAEKAEKVMIGLPALSAETAVAALEVVAREMIEFCRGPESAYLGCRMQYSLIQSAISFLRGTAVVQ